MILLISIEMQSVGMKLLVFSNVVSLICRRKRPVQLLRVDLMFRRWPLLFHVAV